MDKMLSYAKLQKKPKTGLLDWKSENYEFYFFFLSNGSQYVFSSVYSQTMK